MNTVSVWESDAESKEISMDKIRKFAKSLKERDHKPSYPPCVFISLNVMSDEWELYRGGTPCVLTFYDRNGNGHTGTQDEYLEMHGDCQAIVNKNTKEVIVINHYGEIAARGNVL